MRLVIFYKMLVFKLDEIKKFDRQALTEITKLTNPPEMILQLCASVAAILNYKEHTWAEMLKLFNPQNYRLFSQINVIEVHRESLLPFRNFRAKTSLGEVLKLNKSCGMLYIWAHMVDDVYQMTNKEEFRLV